MEKESENFDGGKLPIAMFVFLTLFSFTALSGVENGDFEVTEPNAMGALPTNWETENYALVHSEFTPVFERGQSVEWSFEGATVTPSNGESFLVVSTGDIGVDSASTYGLAKQLIHFESGETLHGKYFFGTGDYLGWNDYAEITLLPLDPNTQRGISVEYIDVSTVGDYQSTDGWQTFAYTFDEYDAGEYYLVFGAYDKTDAIYKSYLMIDDVKCSELPPGGDFNADGDIDYEDIVAFNEVLYMDCDDPNSICTYIDITGNEISYDYDQDGFIDPADVAPAVENWLWKPEED